MSNYVIADGDRSALLLREKHLNRILLGVFLIGFGVALCWISQPETSGSGAFGRVVGGLIGATAILVGLVSLLRRGWVNLDLIWTIALVGAGGFLILA